MHRRDGGNRAATAIQMTEDLDNSPELRQVTPIFRH
jgi:hypothetical protein